MRQDEGQGGSENGGERGAAGQDGGKTPPMPTPVDVLARELLAMRGMATAQLALIDAALTSVRLVQLSQSSRSAADALSESGLKSIADKIRRVGTNGGLPRMFNDRAREADDAGDDEGDAGDRFPVS